MDESDIDDLVEELYDMEVDAILADESFERGKGKSVEKFNRYHSPIGFLTNN